MAHKVFLTHESNTPIPYCWIHLILEKCNLLCENEVICIA